MSPWRRLFDRALEPVVLALTAVWTLRFFYLQTPHLFDPYYLEWDARAHTLSAWRYHGSGLFPNDLLVDFAAVYYPPGVKLVYWIGTFVANPLWLCKILPFALAPIVVWQTYCIGRSFGGRILGAAAVILILHCHFIWGRMVGLDARAFGFPLVLSFLRYAIEKRERPTLAVLLASTLFYPSVFLVCAPAYGLTLLWPWKLDARWLRYAATLAVGGIIVAIGSLHVDPRIGHPITLAELSTLEQRRIVGTYPLPPASLAMHVTIWFSTYDDFGPVLRVLRAVPGRKEGWIIGVAALVFALGAVPRIRRIPMIFVGLAAGSLIAFAAAQAFPYRLYIPERVLHYAWPPLLLLGLLFCAYLTFSLVAKEQRHASLLAALTICGLELGFYGNGMAREINIHDWRSRATDATVRFVATLPKDATIAASFDKSSSIQTFAQRQVLFSSILNTPIYYPIAQEMERRIRDYYLAYYARDWEPITKLRDVDRVDYLVVDARDFGSEAMRRADYLNWTTLARTQVAAGPVDQLVWAHPPNDAVVYRHGFESVIDLHRIGR